MPQNKASTDLDSILNEFIAAQRLPASFGALAQHWYFPLVREIGEQVASRRLAVLGVTGSQGSGKSTLAQFLHRALAQHYNLRIAALSLDDFYLTRRQRQSLADSVHPLLKTRGVPGTHDVQLALDTVEQLLHHSGEVRVPRFDKSSDDRRDIQYWDGITAPVDLVIFEGWCIKAPVQSEEQLREPINQLERNEDREGVWRRYVNQQLEGRYQQLFALLDQLIYLQAPNFDAVYRWRGRQEQKLRAATGDQQTATKIMNEEQLRRFIHHYERLTRQSLASLPSQADIVFKLDEQQNIVERVKNRR